MNNYELVINGCGTYDCSPDWHWEYPGFNDYDLWAVFRGTATLTLDGSSYEVTAGNCVIIPPNATIKGVHDPKNPLFVVSVHFSCIKDSTSVTPIELSHRVISDVSFFRKLLDRTMTAYYCKRAEASDWLMSVLEEFHSYSEVNAENKIQNYHIRSVTEVCEDINTNAGAAKSLADYSAGYGYSATYFGKLFHRVVGVSFSEYLVNARINQAKILLKSSEMSVSQIASYLGYCDVCYFTRQFKSIVGCSPNSYR